MRYTVLDKIAVGGNTAVTISGDGKGLKNDISIIAPNGEFFKLLSVGMTSFENNLKVNQTTSILIEGEFTAKTFVVKSR